MDVSRGDWFAAQLELKAATERMEAARIGYENAQAFADTAHDAWCDGLVQIRATREVLQRRIRRNRRVRVVMYVVVALNLASWLVYMGKLWSVWP